MNCIHNERTRYNTGFQCNDECGLFFPKDSPIYRKDELLSTMWMILHNINVDRSREDKPEDKEAQILKDEIGIGVKHENYEELISRAEIIIKKHRLDEDAATVFLS